MENGQEFSLPSGAKLYVGIASFAHAKALHDAVMSELRGKGVASLDVVEIQQAISGKSQEGLNVIVDKMLAIAASKEIESAIFACADSALYMVDGSQESSVKVSRAIFDDPKTRDSARDDFYQISAKVAEVNLRPFFKALFSMFKDHVERSAAAQKSNTEPEPAKHS